MSQNSQSVDELVRRLGNRGSEEIRAHRRDEARDVFGDLPEIKNGEARLVRVEFVADEGVLKFKAAGKIEAPLYGEGGVRIRGLSVFETIVVPESNPGAKVVEVMDVLRKMVGTDALDSLLPADPSVADLVRAARSVQAVTDAKPIYFRFTNKWEENKKGTTDKTGKLYPGRYWTRWGLAIPDYTPVSALPNVPLPQASTNGHAPVKNGTPDPDPWQGRKGEPPPRGAGDGGDTFPLTGPEPEPDLDELTRRAEDRHKGSQDRLEEMALALNYTKTDVAEATDWFEVGAWVRSGVRKDGTPAPDSEHPAPVFVVGNTVKFLPPDKSSSDPTNRNQKAVDCEVLEVGDQITLRSLTPAKKVWKVRPTDPYVTVPQKK